MSVRNVVAIGIGSSVFLILGRFGSIPTGIPNTNLEISYAFLALMSLIYGPYSGLLIGFVGHTLKDMLFFGTPWFSWIIASSIIGFIIGIGSKFIKLNKFNKLEILKFNLLQIIANVISWMVLAPTLDVLIYPEPLNKVFIQGIFASISNIFTVSTVGTIFLIIYSKSKIKEGSLYKEF